MLRAKSLKQWKATVTHGGAILEGMLLDVLSIQSHRALDEYRKKRKRTAPELSRWQLVELLDVAKRLGILSDWYARTGHYLREIRDLIHPGRRERTSAQIGEPEADIAVAIVKIVFREIAAYEDTRRSVTSGEHH